MIRRRREEKKWFADAAEDAEDADDDDPMISLNPSPPHTVPLRPGAHKEKSAPRRSQTPSVRADPPLLLPPPPPPPVLQQQREGERGKRDGWRERGREG
ncbi:uncharacterized protein V6R79_015012 [Siganus canaliculatus]